METLRTIVGHLKDGELVTMFPEGHLVMQNDAQMDSFKSGMVLMSVMSRKPIVPVYIEPRKSVWHRVHMVVGEPVDIAAVYGPMPTLPDIEKITEELRQHEECLKTILQESRKRP